MVGAAHHPAPPPEVDDHRDERDRQPAEDDPERRQVALARDLDVHPEDGGGMGEGGGDIGLRLRPDPLTPFLQFPPLDRVRIESSASFITQDFHNATVKDSRRSYIWKNLRNTSASPIKEQN